MGAVQFLERSGGQAKWSAKYPLEVGYAGSWVLDKTTDSGTLYRIRVKGEIDKPPVWSNMDWCRVFHGPVEEAVPKYDDEGLPINHEQWLVMSPEKIYNPIAGKWVVSFSLAEPIERARFINCETLTFTNQSLKTVTDGSGNAKIYSKTAYTQLLALWRVLRLTPANCDNYKTGYDRTKNISWYNRIKVLDNTFLHSIPFSDTTFDELTLYNILLDNFDSAVGRTPAFFFDISQSTDLPFNPARDEYKLKFLRQDGFDKPVIEYADLTRKAAQIVETESIDNFATGLVANVQNLSASAEVHYPSKSRFIAPELDTDERDTWNSAKNVSGGDNWILRLPEPIKRVKRLVEYKMSGQIVRGQLGATDDWSLATSNTDISQYVHEKKQYLNLNENNSTYEPSEDSQLIWYEEGKNEVHVKRYHADKRSDGGADDTTSIYNITYEPLIDCKLIVGDEDYTQQINQSSSQIDSTKFAGFLEQYQKGMNKADIIISKTYHRFEDFKDHIGRRVKRGDKQYLITALSYKNRNLQYDVFYQLNENHFRKSDNYQAAQEIRINLNIGIDNIKNRMTAIKKTILLSAIPLNGANNSVASQTGLNLLAAVSPLFQGSVDEEAAFAPQRCGLEVKSTMWVQNSGPESFTKFLVLPITKFRFGNQLCFNAKFADNANAGTKRISGGYGDKPFIDIHKQIPVLYADPFGEVEKLSLYFTAADAKIGSIYNFTNKQDDNSKAAFSEVTAFYRDSLIYPEPTEEEEAWIKSNGTIFKVEDINLEKDMLENLNVNFAFEYKSDNMIICKNMLDLCRLMNDDFASTAFQVEFYDRKIDEFDNITPLKTVPAGSPKHDAAYRWLMYAIEKQTDINFESIALSTLVGTEYKKLLILNEIGGSIEVGLKSGSLSIYY